MANRSSRGFTLIELLIVVTIVGIISAIAIPNMLNALDRGRQKRTMADIRSLATAVEVYAVDFTAYPVAADIATLKPIIEPILIKDASDADAWGTPIIFQSTTTDYTMGSGGKDGGGLNFVGGATTDFNDAIIFVNGQWWQWPEGSQS